MSNDNDLTLSTPHTPPVSWLHLAFLAMESMSGAAERRAAIRWLVSFYGDEREEDIRP